MLYIYPDLFIYIQKVAYTCNKKSKCSIFAHIPCNAYMHALSTHSVYAYKYKIMIHPCIQLHIMICTSMHAYDANSMYWVNYLTMIQCISCRWDLGCTLAVLASKLLLLQISSASQRLEGIAVRWILYWLCFLIFHVITYSSWFAGNGQLTQSLLYIALPLA